LETTDIVGALVPLTYFAFALTERLRPARTFPSRKGWQWIGLGFLVMVMTLSTVIPLLIPAQFLWRGFHQMHHAPQRVDIAGSLVFHPTEVVVQTLLQLFVTVIVLGLDPLAAAITGYLIAFFSFFQHWNVRTPQWIGYLIQRPESHCIHHRMGVHYYNYADLSFWDMLFGTFRNPRQFLGQCGFDNGADRRMGAILAFVDVNAPAYGSGSFGAKPETRAT
jgi:sterol desaturase/sphingolipid hydroxylase (fatty acid hydroxylase superfamily)